jgi:hypothetical protein
MSGMLPDIEIVGLVSPTYLASPLLIEPFHQAAESL